MNSTEDYLDKLLRSITGEPEPEQEQEVDVQIENEANSILDDQKDEFVSLDLGISEEPIYFENTDGDVLNMQGIDVPSAIDAMPVFTDNINIEAESSELENIETHVIESDVMFDNAPIMEDVSLVGNIPTLNEIPTEDDMTLLGDMPAFDNNSSFDSFPADNIITDEETQAIDTTSVMDASSVVDTIPVMDAFSVADTTSAGEEALGADTILSFDGMADLESTSEVGDIPLFDDMPVVEEASALNDIQTFDENPTLNDLPSFEEPAPLVETPALDEFTLQNDISELEEGTLFNETPVIDEIPIIDEASIIAESPIFDDTPASDDLSLDVTTIDDASSSEDTLAVEPLLVEENTLAENPDLVLEEPTGLVMETETSLVPDEMGSIDDLQALLSDLPELDENDVPVEEPIAELSGGEAPIVEDGSEIVFDDMGDEISNIESLLEGAINEGAPNDESIEETSDIGVNSDISSDGGSLGENELPDMTIIPEGEVSLEGESSVDDLLLFDEVPASEEIPLTDEIPISEEVPLNEEMQADGNLLFDGADITATLPSVDEISGVEETLEDDDIAALLNDIENMGKEEVATDTVNIDDADLTSLLADSSDLDMSEIGSILEKDENNVLVGDYSDVSSDLDFTSGLLSEDELFGDMEDILSEEESSGKKKKKEKKKKKQKKNKNSELGEMDALEYSDETDNAEKKPGFFKRLLAALLADDEDDNLDSESVVFEESAIDIAVEGAAENEAILAELEEVPEGKKKKKGKKGKKKEKESEGGDDSENEVDSKKAEKERKKAEKQRLKEERKAEEAKLPKKKLPKKKVIPICILCFSLGVVITLIAFLYPTLREKQKAVEQYQMQDYEGTYELLKGHTLSESEQLMYDRTVTLLQEQRKLDSYRNYMSLDMKPEALNALVQGVKKYEELSARASELDVMPELNSIYTQIAAELSNQFGLTIDKVSQWINIEDSEEYSYIINNYANGRGDDLIGYMESEEGADLTDFDVWSNSVISAEEAEFQ